MSPVNSSTDRAARLIFAIDACGRIAPTRAKGINLRGMFRFEVERDSNKILPSAIAEKMVASTS
jgi:hypothetical protein